MSLQQNSEKALGITSDNTHNSLNIYVKFPFKNTVLHVTCTLRKHLQHKLCDKSQIETIFVENVMRNSTHKYNMQYHKE